MLVKITHHTFHRVCILCDCVSKALVFAIGKGVVVGIHRYYVCWTPLVRLLVFCTPRFDGISSVSTGILDLCVVAHNDNDEKIRGENVERTSREKRSSGLVAGKRIKG